MMGLTPSLDPDLHDFVVDDEEDASTEEEFVVEGFIVLLFD